MKNTRSTSVSLEEFKGVVLEIGEVWKKAVEQVKGIRDYTPTELAHQSTRNEIQAFYNIMDILGMDTEFPRDLVKMAIKAVEKDKP